CTGISISSLFAIAGCAEASIRRLARPTVMGDLARSSETRSWVFFFKQKTAYEIGLGIPAEPLFRSNDKPTISMSLSHCIHQTLNSKASTRFHSGGLQQS